MIVYVVSADCLDYYCGCGNSRGHVFGIASNAESAELLRAKAEADYCDTKVEAVELDTFLRKE